MNETVSKLIAQQDYAGAKKIILNEIANAKDPESLAEWHSFASIFYKICNNYASFCYHSRVALSINPLRLESYTFSASGHLDMAEDIEQATAIIECAGTIGAKAKSDSGTHRFLVTSATIAFLNGKQKAAVVLAEIAFSDYFAQRVRSPDIQSVLNLPALLALIDASFLVEQLSKFRNVDEHLLGELRARK